MTQIFKIIQKTLTVLIGNKCEDNWQQRANDNSMKFPFFPSAHSYRAPLPAVMLFSLVFLLLQVSDVVWIGALQL